MVNGISGKHGADAPCHAQMVQRTAPECARRRPTEERCALGIIQRSPAVTRDRARVSRHYDVRTLLLIFVHLCHNGVFSRCFCRCTCAMFVGLMCEHARRVLSKEVMCCQYVKQ